MSIIGIGTLTSFIGLVSFADNLFGIKIGALIAISLLSMFVAVFMTLSNIGIGTMFQSVVPLDAMGRVGALMGTLLGAMTPLGQMLIGVLIERVNVGFIIVVGGLLCIVSVIIYYRVNASKAELVANVSLM